MGWFDRLFSSAPSSSKPEEPAHVSRRDLLTGGFLRALREVPSPLTKVQAGLDQFEKLSQLEDDGASATASVSSTDTASDYDDSPLHRPPGAVNESEFLSYCSRCSECERACPHQAIVMAPDRYQIKAGTPMIDPIKQPCLMCPDTPCITVCPPAVLYRSPESTFPVMGTARITTTDCLAWQGTTCTTCHERCPAPGAITLDTQVRPIIQPDQCTGCGVCQHVCPAPHNAIIIMPDVDRPMMPYPS